MRDKKSLPTLLLACAMTTTAAFAAGQPSTKPVRAKASSRSAVPTTRPAPKGQAAARPAPRPTARAASPRPAAPKKPASQPTTAAATATAFLGQYMAAFRKGDIKTMMALYRNSPETRSISSRGDDLKGYQAIHKMFTGSFTYVRFTKTVTSQVQARRFGAGIIVYARFEIHSTMKQPPQNRFILRSQGTLLLEQHSGRWVITHEHFSPIMGIPRIEPLPPKQLPPAQPGNDNDNGSDNSPPPNAPPQQNNGSDSGSEGTDEGGHNHSDAGPQDAP